MARTATVAASGIASLDPRGRQRRADRGNEERHAEHADDGRELRDRQHRRLAVAEERPWKATPHVHPSELCRDPEGRHECQSPQSEP